MFLTYIDNFPFLNWTYLLIKSSWSRMVPRRTCCSRMRPHRIFIWELLL